VASDGEVLVVPGGGGDVDEVRVEAARAGVRSTASISSWSVEGTRPK
jgi:hypothetical protein